VLGGMEEHRLKLALRSQLAQHHAHARRLGMHSVEGLPPEREQDAARRLRRALEPRVGELVPVAPRLRTLPERKDGPGGKRHSVPTMDVYESIRRVDDANVWLPFDFDGAVVRCSTMGVRVKVFDDGGESQSVLRSK